EIDPFFYKCLGFRHIVKLRPPVASLYTRTKQIGETLFIMREVLMERFDRSGGAAAVVFDQRDEHPAHGWRFLPGTVVDVLPFDDFLVFAGQRPIGFPVSHCDFGASLQEIPVGYIEVNSLRPAPPIEIAYPDELFPLR